VHGLFSCASSFFVLTRGIGNSNFEYTFDHAHRAGFGCKVSNILKNRYSVAPIRFGPPSRSTESPSVLSDAKFDAQSGPGNVADRRIAEYFGTTTFLKKSGLESFVGVLTLDFRRGGERPPRRADPSLRSPRPARAAAFAIPAGAICTRAMRSASESVLSATRVKLARRRRSARAVPRGGRRMSGAARRTKRRTKRKASTAR